MDEESKAKSKEEIFADIISNIDNFCSKTAISFLAAFLLSAAVVYFLGEKYLILCIIIWFAPAVAGVFGTISTGTTWYSRIRLFVKRKQLKGKLKDELKGEAKGEAESWIGEFFGFLAGMLTQAAAPIAATAVAVGGYVAVHTPEENFLGVSRPPIERITNIQQLFEPQPEPEPVRGHRIVGRISPEKNERALSEGKTITVALLSDNSVIATTQANARGVYAFHDLPDGNFTIGVNIGGAGNLFSMPFTLVSDTIISDRSLALMTFDELQDTLEVLANITTHKILGKLIGSEFDFSGGKRATIALLSDYSVFAATETDSLGRYIFFDVPSGNYTIGINIAGRPNFYLPPFLLTNDTLILTDNVMTLTELFEYKDSIANANIAIAAVQELPDTATFYEIVIAEVIAPILQLAETPVVRVQERVPERIILPPEPEIIPETAIASDRVPEKIERNFVFEEKREPRQAGEPNSILLSIRPEFNMIMDEVNNVGLSAELGLIARNRFFLTTTVSGGENHFGGALNVGAIFNADGTITNSVGITGGWHNTALNFNVVDTQGEPLDRKEGNNIGIAGGYWKIMFGNTGNFDITNRVLFGQRHNSLSFDHTKDEIVSRDGFSTTYSISAGYTLTRRRR